MLGSVQKSLKAWSIGRGRIILKSKSKRGGGRGTKDQTWRLFLDKSPEKPTTVPEALGVPEVCEPGLSYTSDQTCSDPLSYGRGAQLKGRS